jgi:signal transduction histidine kinase
VIFYCVATSLINTLCSLVLAAAAFIKNARAPLNRAFVFLSGSVTVWSGAYFFWQTAKDAETAIVFCRILSVGAFSVVISFHEFARRLRGLPNDWTSWTAYSAIAAVICATPFPALVESVAPKAMFRHWPEPGPLYPAYLAFFFGFFLRALWLLLQGYRSSLEPRRRNQYRWILLGAGIGMSGGATNFFLWYDIPILPFGNGLVPVYVVCLGYAIIRLRLLEFDYALVKIVAYVVAVVPISLVFPGLLALAAFGVPRSQEHAVFIAGAALATLAMFWALPALRRWIDGFLADTVWRERSERHDDLRALGHRITSMRDDETIAREIAKGVHEVVGAPAAIWLWNEGEGACGLRRSIGFAEERLPKTLSVDEPLGAWLNRAKEPLLLDEVEMLDDSAGEGELSEAGHAIVAFRQATGAQVAIPIVGDVFFFGMLLVGHKPQRRIFTEADVALLESLCGQIGLSLRARQLERRANQTERLISLGTLAAGLAHELRNPLVSIQTFASLLAEAGDNAPVPQEFKATVVRDVKRIVGIVENVSAFAANNRVSFGWVALDEVVRQAREIVDADAVEAGVAIETEFSPTAPVYGNQNQILQVVINLLNNAVQALRGRAEARVVVGMNSLRMDDGCEGVALTIADNGPGIDPAILPRVFEPFTTTKDTGRRDRKGGMGLGLAIVKRIVDGHGGHIEVASTQGAGTRFTVYLPCERPDQA